MTACVTFSPSLASALSFIFCKMKAEICCGEYFEGGELQVFLDIRIIEAAADQALDGVERVGRVGDTLALSRKANEALIVSGEGDNGWRRVGTLGVFQNFRLAAVHDRHTRVRRAEVDANNLTHRFNPS
jgi:NAD-specific glutamate dehydrogenase